jgi:quinol monooxygenase YgiN
MKSLVRGIVPFVTSSLFALLTACASPAESTAQATSGIDQGAPQPVVVVAVAKVKDGTAAHFEKAAEALIPPTRNEAGNHRFEFTESQSDPNEFVFVEHWRSQADIDLHFASPHLKAFFAEVQNDFAPGSPVITNLTALDPDPR